MEDRSPDWFQNESCNCGCGDRPPCEFDSRRPLFTEYERLVESGTTGPDALSTIRHKLEQGQHRRCPECRRWILSGDENRTICEQCKQRRKKTRDRKYARARASSGRDAHRKKRDRDLAAHPPSESEINLQIDNVLLECGDERQRKARGLPHVERWRHKTRERTGGMKFLKENKPELLPFVRALINIKPTVTET